MIEKLKELYNDLDLDYKLIEEIYNSIEYIDDSNYKLLISIYEENEYLNVDTQIEECHGIHTFFNYTNESLGKIENFINSLKKLINNDKLNNINFK
jgi:hypothetical protein